MISQLVEHNPVLQEQIERWLTDESGEYASIGIDARRAIIATLAQDQSESHRNYQGLSNSTQTSFVRCSNELLAPLETSCIFSMRQSYSRRVSVEYSITAPVLTSNPQL
jgi:hypothetical protein